MTTNNALNLTEQGVPYYNGTGIFSGLDGGAASQILMSNGTGVAPSFQGPTSSSYLPVITGSVSSGTVAYTNQGGRYTQIGNFVLVTIELLGSISGLPSGDLQISLPSSALTSPTYFGSGICALGATNFSSTIRAGGNIALIYDMTTNTHVQISATTFNIQMTVAYAIG